MTNLDFLRFRGDEQT